MQTDSSQEDVGRVGSITAVEVLAAFTEVKTGRVLDLDAGRFMGMPQWDGHPQFTITSYRTPAGSRVDGDIPLLDPASNAVDLRFHTELIVTGMHIGTHIDALNHVVCGSDGDKFFGGFDNSVVGDSGPLKADAASIPPILVACTVLDIPRLYGLEQLDPGHAITVDELRRAEREQAPIAFGSAVLIRTGLMRFWRSPARFHEQSGAGIDLDAAAWLAHERGVVLVGSDTPTVEVVPSRDPSNPHPVHDYLLRQQGIHLLENVWLEDAVEERVARGLLICLSLKVRGATASMVRPVLVL